MTKKEIYRIRTILEDMKHNKFADTSPSETGDKFLRLYEEAHKICNKTIYKMKPLKT